MSRRLTLCALSALLSACAAVGPDYVRPEVPVPAEFRGAVEPVAAATSETFGDLEWFRIFQDEVLQGLIAEAVASNYDVRIAAQRVLEARSGVTVARSALFPRLDGVYQYQDRGLSSNGLAQTGPGFDDTRSANFLSAEAAWEIDVWGRIRRAVEAADADVLASEENRKFVLQTLVADLSSAYFTLRQLDRELEISRETLASREESRNLIQARLDEGVSNQLELDQAAALVFDAGRRIPDLERRIEAQENAINILLGKEPGPVARGGTLDAQRVEVTVPVGLPSSLLARRPDIRAAEEGIVAANARVGEARAAYFPRVDLAASLGGESVAFTDILDEDSRTWLVGPKITVPFYTAGRLGAQVQQAEARKEQALLRYRQVIQQAFREVGDAVTGVKKTREFTAQQEQLTATLKSQAGLSQARYLGGVTPYLEVLDSERDYFNSQLDLARARSEELRAVVALYRALGGGWQE